MGTELSNNRRSVFFATETLMGSADAIWKIVNEISFLIDGHKMHPFVAAAKVITPKRAIEDKRNLLGLNVKRSFLAHRMGGFENILRFCESAGIHPFFLRPNSAQFLPEEFIDVFEHIVRNKQAKYSQDDVGLARFGLSEEYGRAVSMIPLFSEEEKIIAEIDALCMQGNMRDPTIGRRHFEHHPIDLESRLMLAQLFIDQDIQASREKITSLDARTKNLTDAAVNSTGSVFASAYRLAYLFKSAAAKVIDKDHSLSDVVDGLFSDEASDVIMKQHFRKFSLSYLASLAFSDRHLKDRIARIVDVWVSVVRSERSLSAEEHFNIDLLINKKKIEDLLKLVQSGQIHVPEVFRLHTNKLRIEKMATDGVIPKEVLRYGASQKMNQLKIRRDNI